MNILITGGTGEIGSIFTQKILSKGHTAYMPVRDPDKAARKFGSTVYAKKLNLASPQAVLEYITLQAKNGVIFDKVVLLAGIFEGDDTFFGTTKEEKEEASIKAHYFSNVATAIPIVTALMAVYSDLTKTTLVPVSSWAAHFEVGDPRRENEEGYVQSKYILTTLGQAWKATGRFATVMIEEPPLIDSAMTRKTIPHVLADLANPRITLEEYADHLIQILSF